MKPLLALFAFLFVAQLSAQTVELIQMPLRTLEAKVATGDPEAMVQLALRYSYGIGVEENPKLNNKLYERAAKAGYGTAIGVCAANGWGCAENPQLAFSSIEKACPKGDLTAIRSLGRFYLEGIGCRKDEARGFTLYQKAAIAEDPVARYVLAKAYLSGRGTERDLVKAVQLLQPIAEKISSAKCLLGRCYEQGEGCEKNGPLGLKLITEAAEAGSLEALWVLASKYNRGADGVEKNVAKAYELSRKGAAMGSGDAMRFLAMSHLEGNGVEKSFAKFEEFMLRAADNGDAIAALLRLGWEYEEGKKVGEDYAKALKYYELAGKLGSGRGFNALGLM